MDISAYYRAVASKILPYMMDRPVGVSHKSPGVFTRSLDGAGIEISSEEELLALVEQGVVAFYVSPADRKGVVWFSLGLRAGGVPFEAVRLTALKLILVLRDVEIDGMMVFDGNCGIDLLWTYGVINPDDLPGDIWGFQRDVASALRERLEKRLFDTPERDRIGRWLGWNREVTRFENEGSGDGVTITLRAMNRSGSVRVPFSLNEETLRAAIPLTRNDLYRFDGDKDAEMEKAGRLRRSFEIPLNFPRFVARTLNL